MSNDALLVISNLPDRASAETLAKALVERRAAACVTVMSPCFSAYRWTGAVETAEEHPIFAKTTRDRSDLLRRPPPAVLVDPQRRAQPFGPV